MAADTIAFETDIVPYLQADSTLAALIADRVFTNLATPFPTMPCVLVKYIPGGRDMRCLDGQVYIADLQYEVVAVGRSGDMVALQPIADRLETLLAGVTRDATAFYARILRQSPVERQEVLSGTTRFSHLGATYKVLLSRKY